MYVKQEADKNGTFIIIIIIILIPLPAMWRMDS